MMSLKYGCSGEMQMGTKQIPLFFGETEANTIEWWLAEGCKMELYLSFKQ
jgi:hypothetical protein